MIKLIFESGPLAAHRYRTDVTITLGRDRSNSIVVPDPSLSRVHCQVHAEEGRVVFTDLGSTNGSYINGKRVVMADVHDGDRIELGESVVRVESPRDEIESQMPTVAVDAEVAAPEGHELSGNVFGTVTYYLKRKIADGGMGSVYEADQFGAEGFIKKIAIKTILPSFAEKDMFVSAFVGEAKLVANLVHQNIVQIHHLGRHEGGYFIAMEYIDGINLNDFIKLHRHRRKKVPVDIASFIVSRVARGLEYAHGMCDETGKPLGLVHRDVSPNNIMITREGEVKLTDFGVAKAAQFMENDDEYLVGSVEYMSPEQADCAAVDARSDIYSVGLVYYELLTGLRVYRCNDGDIEATVRQVVEGKVPDPGLYRARIPDVVRSILLRCLQRNVEDRYATSGELSGDLEHELYSRGYGPTIATLASYLAELTCRDDT